MGKPMRRSFAQVYITLFRIREGRGLYEKMQSWLAAFNDTRKDSSIRLWVQAPSNSPYRCCPALSGPRADIGLLVSGTLWSFCAICLLRTEAL